MLGNLIKLVSLGLVATMLAGCGPVPRVPIVMHLADGRYNLLSPCGEPILHVQVMKSESVTEAKIYWEAIANPGRGVASVNLFVENAGYSVTGILEPLALSTEYIVRINGEGSGTTIVPEQVGEGRGVWQREVFESYKLEEEQKKVLERSCGR